MAGISWEHHCESKMHLGVVWARKVLISEGANHGLKVENVPPKEILELKNLLTYLIVSVHACVLIVTGFHDPRW